MKVKEKTLSSISMKHFWPNITHKQERREEFIILRNQ